MRRNIPFVILAVLIVAAAFTTGVAYHQSTEKPTVLLMDQCSRTPVSAPSNIVVACADANTELSDLHWYAWGDATAYATGNAQWNDCTPTCVAGTWRSRPVTVWAWDIKNGFYTKLASDAPSNFTF
jgi:hypothetical protein